MTQSDLLIEMGFGHGTNDVCPEYVEAFDFAGCERCGHQRHKHANG